MVAAIVASLIAIVVVPLMILRYGRHDPSPPSLEDDPDPAIPGEILYFDHDGCVVRAKASGESREVATCESAGGFASFVTWLDADTIAVASGWNPTAPFMATTIDLRTGATGSATIRSASDSLPGGIGVPSAQESVHGERVSISEDGKVTILAGTSKREIADFDVERYRIPQFVTWSPDGEWMLLSYYDEDDVELWVLSRDGATRGTLARDVRQPTASWYIEGLGAWPKVEVVP